MSGASEDLVSRIDAQNRQALERIREELEALRDLLLIGSAEGTGDQLNARTATAKDTATIKAEPTGENHR